MISIKSKREIKLMRKTCRLARDTLKWSSKLLRPGISTQEINDQTHDYITKKKAYPSPLNYMGFPKSICTSKNEVICHGIPSSKDILKDGDIINIDITTKLNNYHGDTNATFVIGRVSPEIEKFIKTAQDCLMAGIEVVRPDGHFGDIGAVIEELAFSRGYTVVHEYCGHGIGRQFHEAPQILHYGKKGTGERMLPGMVFTIEPMINIGARHCKVLEDNWTVVTKDGKLSAQFEHTILVSENGYEILTL